jgi:hypothetical protein
VIKLAYDDNQTKSAAELASEAKTDYQRSNQLWQDAKEAKQRGDYSGYEDLKNASEQLETESKVEQALADKKYNE